MDDRGNMYVLLKTVETIRIWHGHKFCCYEYFFIYNYASIHQV